MTFRYKEFPTQGDPGSAYNVFGPHILRPIIPIGLSWGSQALESFALIDSGADLNLFDAELGAALGIDVLDGEAVPFSGAQEGRPTIAYLHNVFLVVGTKRFQAPVFFSYHLNNNGHGLLGQRGFFDRFLVTFDYRKELIQLKDKR